MGVYFNWGDIRGDTLHDEDLSPGERSREAGAAVADAIARAAEVMRFVERRGLASEGLSLGPIAEPLEFASGIYRDLIAEADDRPVPISAGMRLALAGAVACSESVGGALLRAALGDQAGVAEPSAFARPRLSAREMMRTAFLLTAEAGRQLQTLTLRSADPLTARRVAADLAVLQVFGVVIAELLDRRSLTKILEEE